MKSVAIFLVGLIAVSSFQTDLFEKHRMTQRSIMDVMVQVEASIKANSPVDTVNQMLADFKTSVTSEQLAHDDLYVRQQAECASELEFRKGQIQDASKILQVSNAQLNLCSNQLVKHKAEHGMMDDHLTMNQQHLALIQDVRRAEQEAFARMQVIFNDALHAIDDAVYVSKKFSVGDASLIEMADSTGQLMQHAVKLGRTSHYAAVLASLARLSLAQQVNQADVDRLIQLLTTLRDAIEDAFRQFADGNTESIQMYNDQKERIQKNIDRLDKSKTKLEDEIVELNGCVATQTAISQAASNKKQRNVRLNNDATLLCTTFNGEYEAATAGRRQELVVLAELERLVEKRFKEQHQ